MPAEAEIAGWVVVAILLTIALVVVMIAYQKRSGRRRPATAGTRESVRSQADPLYDVAKLLFNLLPERFRKRGQMRPYTLPQGDPGVVDALRMYYRLLTIGEKKGVARSPSETPTEFQGKLEKIFPPDLVSMVTAAFDRACYGYHPSSEEHLGQMRALFEQLEPGH